MAGVTDGNNWEANLGALGKLERGDMLAKAGSDGKLVRKTNWLTQATNKSKTHDDDLFKQIEEVLNFAETKIDVDPEGQAPLIKQYIQANKGLEILLSTYRSKGSKETYLIDKLTLLLANHAVNYETKNRDADPNIQTLKKHAEQAIKFVNDCRIRSVNNNLGNSYFGNKFDKALFSLLVRGASNIRLGINFTTKDLKTAVAAIVRMPVSRSKKKELLADALNQMSSPTQKHRDLGLDWLTAKYDGDRTGRVFWPTYKTVDGELRKQIKLREKSPLPKPPYTNFEEAVRIKITKRTIRNRLGNCWDKACVAATHLIENTKGKIAIARVNGSVYDHAWVLISKNKRELLDAIETCEEKGRSRNNNYKKIFPKDTWVVDGWTRDWWELRAWFNSACNARQILVRHRIRKAICDGNIVLAEDVTWPPQPTMAWFRLRFAHLAALDWDMVKDLEGMKWQDFQNAITILKNCRNELTQIFENNLVQDVIDNQNIDSLVGEISEAHNSARPVSAEIKRTSSRISAKKSAHNSLEYRGSSSI